MQNVAPMALGAPRWSLTQAAAVTRFRAFNSISSGSRHRAWRGEKSWPAPALARQKMLAVSSDRIQSRREEEGEQEEQQKAPGKKHQSGSGHSADADDDEKQDPVERELDVAIRAVQLGCMLAQRVQEKILSNEENAGSKLDKSLVTIADWGVQAVVSWVLAQSFGDENLSIIAEEDTKELKGMQGIHTLQRVVQAVNSCLSEASAVALQPPARPLETIEVLKAISRGNSPGGSTGKHWLLDPIDGTLGFVRGDQYAIALGLIQDGELVLGVLGCPNYPMRSEWLNYHHRYYRLASRISPPPPHLWHKGCILSSRRDSGKVRMQPLMNSDLHSPRFVTVSPIDDPAQARFCEPVEKANTSHSFTAGVADSLGLRKEPLRVYSMAKYAAIARGDAQIFMKFARAGYREKVWDHAAGVLIVEEAGGVVTDAGGRKLDFSRGRYLEGLDRGIIASCGPKLHERIVAAVDASWNSSRL